jgi:hypothetical protein
VTIPRRYLAVVQAVTRWPDSSVVVRHGPMLVATIRP